MVPEEVKRKRSPLVTCAVLFFGVITLIIAGALWVVAATGLVPIPVFSRLAYDVPEPTRVVSPGVSVETYLQTVISEELVRRLYMGQGALQDRDLVVTLPENALTASLQAMDESIGLDLLDIPNSQVAISNEFGTELFFPLKYSEQDTAIRMHMKAVAEDGVVQVQLNDVWVGSLHVPMFFVGMAANNYLRESLVELNEQMGQYLRLTEISYEDGSMTMTGELAVELMEWGL